MDNKKVIEDWKNRARPTKAEYYEMRVKKFEANGLTRSDAQALVDANDLRMKNLVIPLDINGDAVVDTATWQDELEEKLQCDAILDADLAWERYER